VRQGVQGRALPRLELRLVYRGRERVAARGDRRRPPPLPPCHTARHAARGIAGCEYSELVQELLDAVGIQQGLLQPGDLLEYFARHALPLPGGPS
jgi:hypothetical protein